MDFQDEQDFVLVRGDDVHGYDQELLSQPPEVLASILKWPKPKDHLGEGSEYVKSPRFLSCRYEPSLLETLEATISRPSWVNGKVNIEDATDEIKSRLIL